MATHDIRRQDRDRLARFLGWFSIGLGTAQVTAPRAMCRLIGAEGKGRSPLVMRLMGVREIAQGSGILTRARPTGFVWSRVVGDAVDLGALVVVAKNGKHPGRTAFAIANVAGIAVPDVFEAIHLAKQQGEPQSGKRMRKAVTIAKPRQEVEQAWSIAQELREKVDSHGARVSFEPAPGDRGTEVAVEWMFDPPAGELGALAKKLSGNDLATQLSDDLRRFKARVETGEVVRSDGTPDGHLLADHLKQRAAQPLEREEVNA